MRLSGFRLCRIKVTFLFWVWFIVWGIGLSGCKKEEKLSENTVRVVRALDGDTVLLHNGEKLRYAGVDSPELNHGKGLPPQPFAEEAYSLNRQLTVREGF